MVHVHLTTLNEFYKKFIFIAVFSIPWSSHIVESLLVYRFQPHVTRTTLNFHSRNNHRFTPPEKQNVFKPRATRFETEKVRALTRNTGQPNLIYLDRRRRNPYLRAFRPAVSRDTRRRTVNFHLPARPNKFTG